jgi:NAD(P)-dependent dehydrogenase (short-subunit alcohol dehydrogenase family)
MKGKVIIVTGASAGIGKESALDLVRHGAQVILACRNEQRTKEAMKSLNEEEKKLIKFIKCDLNDFNSIIKFAEQVKKEYAKIDILMNNAGLFPQQYNVTKDNFESYLQGNFTGHVLLTFLLFDILDKNDARIINLSSIAYLGTDFTNDINIKELYDLRKSEEKYFGGIKGKGRLYSNTKILMIYFSKYLTKICEKKYTYIKSAAVHPGGVDTDFLRFLKEDNYQFLYYFSKLFTPLIKFMFKTPVDGAQTQLNLCYLPFSEFISGAYYSDCKETKTKKFANDFNKINECMELTIQEIKKRIPDTKIFDILNDDFNIKEA